MIVHLVRYSFLKVCAALDKVLEYRCRIYEVGFAWVIRPAKTGGGSDGSCKGLLACHAPPNGAGEAQ